MAKRLGYLVLTVLCSIAAVTYRENAAAQVSSSKNIGVVVTHDPASGGASPAITDIQLTGPGTISAGVTIPGFYAEGNGAAYVGNLHAITSAPAFNDNLNYQGSIGAYTLATSATGTNGSCSGPDSGHFFIQISELGYPLVTTLNSNGPLAAGGGSGPGGAYSICVVATQSGLGGSPFVKQFNITAEAQAISNIWLSNTTFTPSLANTLVGWISVPVSPASPIFNGTLSVSDTAHFQIITEGANHYLVTNGPLPSSPSSYSITITAGEPGSFNQNFTITANAGPFAASQTFLPPYAGTSVTGYTGNVGQIMGYGPWWVMQAPAGAGSASQTIGAVPVLPYPAYPVPATTCSLSGVDAGLFTLSGCTLKVGASNLPCPGGGTASWMCRPITSMTYDAAKGGIDVVLPNTYPSPVSGTGQVVIVYGAVNNNTGDFSGVNGPMPVIAYTDPQHFTLGSYFAPSSITPGNLEFTVRVDETASGVAAPVTPNWVAVSGINPSAGTQSCSGGAGSWTAPMIVQPSTYVSSAGAKITATLTNVPNCNNNDQFVLDWTSDRDASNLPNNSNNVCQLPAGAHSYTCTFTVPYIPSDDYAFYAIKYFPNGSYGNGPPQAQTVIATTPPEPYLPPGATNTLAAPFTPSQILTVCPSGCMYTSILNAMIGLSNSNHSNTADNVEVTVGQGTYMWDCWNYDLTPGGIIWSPPTNDGTWHIPPHLWIKGIGGDRPHLHSGWLLAGANCYAAQAVLELWGLSTTNIWIDNLDISDWAGGGNSAGVWIGGAQGTYTLRNDYIHDGGDNGIVGTEGNNPANVVIQNTVLARLGTGPGPKHNIYMGEAYTSASGAGAGGTNNSFLFQNSISQQSFGHDIKLRQPYNTINCSEEIAGIDQYFTDSLNIEFNEANPSASVTHNIGIRRYPAANTQASVALGDNATTTPPPPPSWYYNMANNIFIWDANPASQGQYWFTKDWINQTAVPQTWTNNIYIGGQGGQSEHIQMISAGDPNYGSPSCRPNGGCTALQTDILPNNELVYPDRVAASAATGLSLNVEFPAFPTSWDCGTVGNMSVP